MGVDRTRVEGVVADVGAGIGAASSLFGPDDVRIATGFRVGPDARRTIIWRSCADDLDGLDCDAVVFDQSGDTTAWRMCR